MPSERQPDERTTDGTSAQALRARFFGRRRIASLLFLVFGLGVALYLGKVGPEEQHVRVVLGDSSKDVTALEIQYVAEDGEIARDMRAMYPSGAPRVVALDPKLPDGDYRLRIDADAQSGRRSVERRVKLAGGTTQVDISAALRE